MTPDRGPVPAEERVLLLAPTRKDAALTTGILEKAGIRSEAVDPWDIPRQIAAGAGAVIMAADTVIGAPKPLVAALEAQPAWSDLPLVMLTYGGASANVAARVMERFGNVILLERPVRVNTLVSAVRTALRARRKQYQVRDHMNYREQLKQELERKVSERTEALTASNKDLESFCYTVAHDLRTPLRGINGFAHLLKMRLDQKAEKLSAEENEYFSLIRAASNRMGRLIDDLLNLARLSRRELRREAVDLSALADSIVEELRRASPKRKVRVKIAGGIAARGDPDLLRIVVQNLLENAWKFTGPVPRPAVEFGLTQGGSACYVRDNGVGFDMAYSGHLFGVFQRLHSEEEFPGNGIGLATVERIIAKHGGRVWAESKPGRGAAFYFTLPMLEERRKKPRERVGDGR